MKVAFLITLPELGGAQTHVYQILGALDRERYEPILLTAGRGWLTEQAEQLGIRTYPLQHLVRSIRPLRDLLALCELWRILRRERPEVLHLHSSKAGIIGRLAGRLAGVERIVFTAHGFSFHERLKPLPLKGFVWLEKAIAPLADVIVPVSDYDRDRALSFGLCSPDKLRVVRNGIETDRFQGLDRKLQRTALGADDETILIGMVARFAFPKDHETLLWGAQELLKERPQVRLVLVGSGPELPRIELLAEELGIRERIDFLGDREDIPALLSALDVFTLASRFEALPMTIIEAMAAGLPVVASQVGGIRELVQEGETGLCVPREDAEALRQALLGLVDAPALRRRLGEAARLRALREFDTSRMIRQLEALYGKEGQPAG